MVKERVYSRKVRNINEMDRIQTVVSSIPHEMCDDEQIETPCKHPAHTMYLLAINGFRHVSVNFDSSCISSSDLLL
jgi:hypothetical protein